MKSPVRGALRHAATALVLGAGTLRAQEAPPIPPLHEMSLEELLDVSVVSASNRPERLSDAPATVIVVTRKEIDARGYTEFSELLDDLPGMDVVRPWGATYLKDYWRGYRNTIGEPFLFMVDGIVQNHLYFNTADGMVTLPLSNIERVEVVYGPASSVYGPNASMGVINVITRRERAGDGTSVSARLTAGGQATRIVDASALWQKERVRISATARFDAGDLDASHAGTYEYTKDQYFGDRRLWGGFLDNPALGGSFQSHHENTGVDLRLYTGELELGLLYDELRSGYGDEYPGDRAQNDAIWSRPQLSLFGRLHHDLGGGLTGTTLVRWRKSDVGNDSTFLEGYNVTSGGRAVRVADYSYWQSLNRSWSLLQDFEWHLAGPFQLSAGLKWEHKDLQKAYDTDYGPSLPIDQIDASTYPYPRPPVASTIDANRITTEDFGFYAQARYALTPRETLHLGVRFDHHSRYGTTPTVRAGWVGSFGELGVKALYGEAFQEPVPRLLYGGWQGSGSDPNLDPERSRTVELSATWTKKSATALVSGWWVGSRDTIVNTEGGARNLGDRKVTGLDVSGQLLVPCPSPFSVRLWAFWSHIFSARETKFDAEGNESGTGFVGDIARDKLFLGVTASWREKVTATVRARFVGRRDTVWSNPVGSVGSYTSVDATLQVKDVGVRGLGVLAKLTNAMDETILQPGVRDANAGTTPGAWDASGVWHGSQSFYSSLLPQPGRLLSVTGVIEF